MIEQETRRMHHMLASRMKCLTITAFALVLVLNAVPAKAQGGQRQADIQIPEGAYSVVAQVRAKPGKENELRAATLPLIAKVRAEPNNLVYFFQENREKPGHFVFYEVFASKADFDAHTVTPHVREWFAKLPDLADGDVNITHLSVLSGRGK
jgi:quinol monooxygenase YgiN